MDTARYDELVNQIPDSLSENYDDLNLRADSAGLPWMLSQLFRLLDLRLSTSSVAIHKSGNDISTAAGRLTQQIESLDSNVTCEIEQLTRALTDSNLSNEKLSQKIFELNKTIALATWLATVCAAITVTFLIAEKLNLFVRS